MSLERKATKRLPASPLQLFGVRVHVQKNVAVLPLKQDVQICLSSGILRLAPLFNSRIKGPVVGDGAGARHTQPTIDTSDAASRDLAFQ